MTRLPTDSWDVSPHTGDLFPKYKCSSLCAHPTCSRFADHAHHICRRSFIIGDVAWVSYADGPIVGNLCGLCYMHHEMITLNRSAILWDSKLKRYIWTNTDLGTGEVGESLGPLYPHPPLHAERVAGPKGKPPHVHGPADDSLCPECQRPLKRPKETGEKKEDAKRRKTWAITVPDDTDEDGALVLDTLVEECAKLFGREGEGKLRYYVVAQALALIIQNESLLSD